MSKLKGYTQISLHEAFALIGFHEKDKKTYFLENLIIEYIDGGLKITHISPKHIATPDLVVETKEPFRYKNKLKNFLIVNQDGNISVFEEDQDIMQIQYQYKNAKV